MINHRVQQICSISNSLNKLTFLATELALGAKIIFYNGYCLVLIVEFGFTDMASLNESGFMTPPPSVSVFKHERLWLCPT